LTGYLYEGFSNEDVTTPLWNLHEEKAVEMMMGILEETKVATVGELDKSTQMTWGAEGWSMQQLYKDGIFTLSQKVSADVGVGQYNETKDVTQKAAFEVAKTLDYDGALIQLEMSAINQGDVNTGAGLSLDATLVDELSAMASSTDDGTPNIPGVPAHCEWMEAYCQPGEPAQCVQGGCVDCDVPGKCVGGSCDQCGVNPGDDNRPCASIMEEGECNDCDCCTWIPAHSTCETCCTLKPATDSKCVPAHCEWMPEVPEVWGIQDIYTFDVDAVWLEGNIQTGLSVLTKDTQDIEATEHQSWTGAFTFSKSYVVTDNDPIPEPGPAAPPVPIPPVP